MKRLEQFYFELKLISEWIPIITLGIVLGIFVNLIFSVKFFFDRVGLFVNRYFICIIIENISVAFLIYFCYSLILNLKNLIGRLDKEQGHFAELLDYLSESRNIAKKFFWISLGIISIYLFSMFIRETVLNYNFYSFKIMSFSALIIGFLAFITTIFPILLPIILLIRRIECMIRDNSLFTPSQPIDSSQINQRSSL